MTISALQDDGGEIERLDHGGDVLDERFAPQVLRPPLTAAVAPLIHGMAAEAIQLAGELRPFACVPSQTVNEQGGSAPAAERPVGELDAISPHVSPVVHGANLRIQAIACQPIADRRL